MDIRGDPNNQMDAQQISNSNRSLISQQIQKQNVQNNIDISNMMKDYTTLLDNIRDTAGTPLCLQNDNSYLIAQQVVNQSRSP